MSICSKITLCLFGAFFLINIQAADPVLHMPFDEDAKGKMKNNKEIAGIIHGKTIYNDGINGKGLVVKRRAYDQVTCVQVKLPETLDFTKGTIAFWFKPEWNGAGSERHDLIRFKAGKRLKIKLVKNSKGLWDYSVVDGVQRQIIKKCAFKEGVWHHIALAWDLSKCETAFYIDGKAFKKDFPPSQDKSAKAWKPAEFWLGDRSYNNYKSVVGDGVYDDLKVFTENLSPAEIQDLAISGKKEVDAVELDLKDAKPISSIPSGVLSSFVKLADVTLFKGKNLYYEKSDSKSLSFNFKLKKEKYVSPVEIISVDASGINISLSTSGEKGQILLKLEKNGKNAFLRSPYRLTFDKVHNVFVNVDNGKASFFIDGAFQSEKEIPASSIGKINKITMSGEVAEMRNLLALNKALSKTAITKFLKREEIFDGMERLQISRLSKLESKLWTLRDAKKKEEGVRKGVCLNGIWRAVPTNEYTVYPPDESWGFMRVPGSFRSPLFEIYKEKKGELVSMNWRWKKNPLLKYRAGWYQRAFVVPDFLKGKNIFLNFTNIVGDYGRIYLNGELIGSFVNDSPFYTGIPNKMRIDVARYLKPGENTLTVFIDRKYSKLWRGVPSITDHGEMAIDDVWLESGPSSLQLASVLAFPSFRKKDVSFKIRILNPEQIKGAAKIKADFVYAGKMEKEFETKCELTGEKEETVTFKMPWSSPKLWDEENPNLYKMSVAVSDKNGKLLDAAAPVNFGFREFWVENGAFYLNGKETRLRMWSSPGINRLRFYYGTEKGLKQYISKLKKMGYNTTRCNPMRGLSSQVAWDDKFNESDKQGFYHLQPAPPYEGVAPIERYKKHIEKYMEAFANHPSIIMWYTDFNTCGYRWNQDPGKLNDTKYVPQHKLGSIKLAKTAEKVINAADPSRETFQHAGGNTGKIFGSMNYQSLGVPLQEREDWPKQWSANHTQPLMVAECGFPYHNQFLQFDLEPSRGNAGLKGIKSRHEFLLAEHAARYFGDKAYEKARPASQEVRQPSLQLSGYPKNFIDIKKLVADSTIKAWRGYNISALGHFPGGRDHMELFYTIPKANVVYEIREDVKNPGIKPDRSGTNSEVHEHILSDYTKPNELYSTFQRAFAPLLIFLSGPPEDFTNKDHAFYSGEEFTKGVVAVNDKTTEQELHFAWKLVDKENNKTLEENSFSEEIQPGKIGKFPIELKVPKVYKRTDAVLNLEVIQDDRLICEDSMDLQFFPKHHPVIFKDASVALYDPQGQTEKMLKEAALPFQKVNKILEMKDKRLLIIGKNALGKKPPEFLRDLEKSGMIENGLKVLVFEQKQCNLGNLVFERPSQRVAFMRIPEHPAVNGLKDEDLRNWRGGTDTVPEFVVADEHTPHYPRAKWKCGNSGIVAGWVIRKPQYGNFTPIVDCGFNLMNSPLLELRLGRGIIVFCQLDLTHRYLKDPVATIIADKILEYMASPFVPIHAPRCAYLGTDKKETALLKRMGAEVKNIKRLRNLRPYAPYHIIILGKGCEKEVEKKKKELRGFLEKGGCVFVMPGVDLSCLPFNIKTDEREVFKVILPENEQVFSGVPNADLYFRYPKKIQVITQAPHWTVLSKPAVIAKIQEGKGTLVIFNVDPLKIDGLWNKEKTVRAMCKVLSNMGVSQAKDYKLFLSDKYRHNQIGNPCLVLDDWEIKTDPQNKGKENGWFKDIYSLRGFVPLKTPGAWELSGITQKNPDYKYPPGASRKLIQPYDGYAWCRTKFVLPEKWKGRDIFFSSGPIDDNDWTYVNGHLVGSTTFETHPKAYALDRRYKIPAKYLKFGGENVIAIRVFDKWGYGGIMKEAFIEPDRTAGRSSWSPYIDDLDFYDVDAFHNW